MRGGGRLNFPQWNYGYTLGPPSLANGGNYTQFNMEQQALINNGGVPTPQHYSGGGRPPFRGHSRGHRGGATPYRNSAPAAAANKPTPASSTPLSAKTTDEPFKEETPAQAEQATATGPQTTPAEGGKEEGELIERPMNEILRGRNPIMFCNDQSKMRNLHMEWEQVSETGPPHDKTFTWSLKMGEITVLGDANSKKMAKNKAAEEMVKKLDQLPKVNMKRHFQQAFGAGMPPYMMRGGGAGGRGGRGGRGGYYGSVPPPWFGGQQGQPQQFNNVKKRKNNDSVAAAKPEDVIIKEIGKVDDPLHPAQNNPISKLYEYSKKRKMPEPLFETVQEEVLETRKTSQGFTYKKTKFTMQCEINGKKYLGDSMNKKTAKFNSAAAAWAEIGAGVGQASIDSLLQSGRQAAAAATTTTA
jgi:dsRNA-specific ribonuclease